MKEILEFEECTAQEWLQALKDGFKGMCSNSSNFLYDYDDGIIYRNDSRYKLGIEEINKWIDTLDNDYRTFYIVNRRTK